MLIGIKDNVRYVSNLINVLKLFRLTRRILFTVSGGSCEMRRQAVDTTVVGTLVLRKQGVFQLKLLHQKMCLYVC